MNIYRDKGSSCLNPRPGIIEPTMSSLTPEMSTSLNKQKVSLGLSISHKITISEVCSLNKSNQPCHIFYLYQSSVQHLSFYPIFGFSWHEWFQKPQLRCPEWLYWIRRPCQLGRAKCLSIDCSELLTFYITYYRGKLGVKSLTICRFSHFGPHSCYLNHLGTYHLSSTIHTLQKYPRQLYSNKIRKKLDWSHPG